MPDAALTPDDIERAEAAFGPLAESLRTLVDLAIRSRVDDERAHRARALIEQAGAILSEQLSPDSPGVQPTTDGRTLTWGNVMIGVRNAIAPPLRVHRAANNSAAADLVLGTPYEGPPGLVHGGVCAMLLDHVLGATAHRPGSPAFTGTLTLRYVAPTPLGRLRVEAWVEREENGKTFSAGHILDAEGTVTVEAHGVFIRPRPRS
ncbi:thioesterase superfamily protein [Mycolicibacterium hassiacum DSM 44199]|jgi:acyl-coenzyme A thioesterase PaaI-like protein|uniref:Acyl-coenzyme A thioesterase THEM4 n=1 Tax=Mycolicibacterium hassiacum (strain DSM 44199 / CIP 105218 / JCM 12690 / 3849) TaxID=1122247 RepID=K5BFL8_MYCHD|nr:PaaI family thioesterase [Mycolicibacterium hassiacum]EKF24032.1 thioesterase superfamily protein [Mycolicibacterium hassiacum DSM 44199]MBX5485360.1 PaaI family thioesterase [Mycolicibacterium hassiacum]MDA4086287.1 thioesterase [Mycolicibacterium hassiacum DSM 44199]PZN24266.1 MAG: PaaI family thioesterase [Mycolicibacterium hassiacum]VCT90773.1 hypothetical protein MHAS_02482 [Mycolicibacterium hassiacum DSM 44199]